MSNTKRKKRSVSLVNVEHEKSMLSPISQPNAQMSSQTQWFSDLGISKRGDTYLRKLLIHGARSALQFADRKDDVRSRWAVDVTKSREGGRGRRGKNVAAVALANKMVRSAWVLLSRSEEYKMAVAV